MELAPGTVFASDYEVQRELSAGGMGRVYVVLQKSTGKQRALKLMLPQLVSDPSLRKRFEQEARVASLIESDHVVEVVGAGIDEASGAPWLAMELLKGGELTAQAVAASGQPLAFTSAILEQVCHAVGAAHAAGIVHRDLKPENIFLAESKRAGERSTVKVLDFGIAKIAAEASTQHTAAMGSPIWMAPEQSEKGGVTPAADVWALGLITYYLLTGKYFWHTAEANGTLHQVMREVLFEPIPPASQRAAEQGVAAALPPWFDGWFARCVVRDPAQRFPDARAFFSAFPAAAPARASMQPPSATAMAATAPMTAMAPPMSAPPAPMGPVQTSAAPNVPAQLGGATAPAVFVPSQPPPAQAVPAQPARSRIRRFIGYVAVAFVLVIMSGVLKKRVFETSDRASASRGQDGQNGHDAVDNDSADDPQEDNTGPVPTLSLSIPTPTGKKRPPKPGHGTPSSLSSAIAAEASGSPGAGTPNNEGGFQRVVAIERLNDVPLEQTCGGIPGGSGKGSAVVTFNPNGRVAASEIFPEGLRGTPAGTCIEQMLKSDTRVQVPAFQGPPRKVVRQFFLKNPGAN